VRNAPRVESVVVAMVKLVAAAVVGVAAMAAVVGVAIAP